MESLIKKKGPAQPPKDTVNPNNGIQCICKDNGPVIGCRASHHIPRPDRYEEFIDKNGTQIKTGDHVRYTNPRFPERDTAIHIFEWSEYNNTGLFIVDGKRRKARGHGRFTSERWEII
tara:strand:+ start:279 stop:632 length:354 start_codon:yes stop_codon:yes gene_type:complete